MNVLWVLHYYLLYHLPQGTWRTVLALSCICVQTKPYVLLLNFGASRKLTERLSNLPLKSRKFGFISCHLCTQPRPISTLSLSVGTPKLRKFLFPDLCFWFIVGLWPTVKILLTGLFEESYLCELNNPQGQSYFSKRNPSSRTQQNSWSQLKSSLCPWETNLLSLSAEKRKLQNRSYLNVNW